MAAISSLILGGLVLGKTAYDVSNARKGAKAARKTGEFEQRMYEQQAQDAKLRGEEQANQVGSQSRQLTGAQRVSLAAQGIEAGSGSASDVISNDQRLAELAEDQIRLNAAREAFGFTEQGKLARMGANVTAQSYNNQAVSTILGGAADLFSIYQSYGKNKVPRVKPPKPPQSSGGYEGEWRPDTGGW